MTIAFNQIYHGVRYWKSTNIVVERRTRTTHFPPFGQMLWPSSTRRDI